ncbi:MAG: FAD-binding protein [Rhizobiales bacterium]|nr:FAD-binding protein [Hyphomicrobiales bacterium]
MTVHAPRSEAEAAEIVRAARGPLAIEGGGTRSGYGRPAQAAATLSTRNLAGIALYNPAEMTIVARAGTTVSEIEAALAEQGQMLPFEPLDPRPLWGGAGEPTIGGVTASALAGPRRIQAGGVRDSLVGVRFVNGRGDIVKSGGRVMKNVTGLDLVKLQCGAMGALGLIVEVAFKLLPRPQAGATLALDGLDDARAVAALSAALGSPFEASGGAHLPARGGAPARTLVRLENFEESIRYRVAQMTTLLAPFGRAMRLDDAEADALWRDIRDARPFAAPDARAVWRVSTAPSRSPALVAAIGACMSVEAFYDWGGGLVWLACDAAGDAGASIIRGALAGGGHATLMRAPDAVRAATEVFQPQTAALAALGASLKQAFDPDRLFNPGRMVARH